MEGFSNDDLQGLHEKLLFEIVTCKDNEIQLPFVTSFLQRHVKSLLLFIASTADHNFFGRHLFSLVRRLQLISNYFCFNRVSACSNKDFKAIIFEPTYEHILCTN